MARYKFSFEATMDPRKGIPYVARLVVRDGKLEREFYNLKREYGKKSITVWGEFTAEDGDVIEMREGASWKNDYRYWYLVYKGKLYLLADVNSSKRKRYVIDYLSGELTMEEMLDALGVKVEEEKEEGKVVSKTVAQ
ncbi:MAG: hypothetical protein ACO2PP_13235 [Thermocrinis sp.]|jgi:hypothetical protein|uniref:hypothetical protein n=1 Tax=Thermocrinis sp. TaxID=2024383 RepID=UPI003BFC160F